MITSVNEQLLVNRPSCRLTCQHVCQPAMTSIALQLLVDVWLNFGRRTRLSRPRHFRVDSGVLVDRCKASVNAPNTVDQDIHASTELRWLTSPMYWSTSFCSSIDIRRSTSWYRLADYSCTLTDNYMLTDVTSDDVNMLVDRPHFYVSRPNYI